MKSNEKKNLTLKLTPLENAVIHTKTEKSYLELMKVYEVGGWSFMLGGLPTEKNYWKRFKEKTCITTKVEYGFSPRNYYQESGSEILSPNEFYKKQRITPNKIKVINRYYKNKYKNDRKSKT